jgi:two-component system sensor kinase FixL
MGEIAGESLRAGQILRRLRDFVTRGESDKQVECVSAMIAEASGFARTGFEGLEVDVQFDFASNVADVVANRIQVQQVLVNLMRNAFESMVSIDGGHELHVATLRLNEDMIEISVADDGPGLTPEVAGQLFEPFVSSKHDGMGLGLSICRSIVESHGGTLHYEPNPKGGTIFRFTLPSTTLTEKDHAQ